VRKFLAAVPGFFLALFLVTSCGSGQSDGVTFYVNNASEPESLDPALISGVPDHRIYMNLFEGLVGYDPQTADPVPGVAESWKISDDRLTYTFTLREGIVWSDGTPITAQQVVDSWLRILDPETAAPYAWFPSMILKGAAEYNAGEASASDVAIEALDDRTFRMELVGPAPYALSMLGHYSFAVLPMHVIEEYGDQWTLEENFVGNGPFVLESHKPQEEISMIPNERYWDRDAVQLDRVVMYPIEDNTTAHSMFINQELDWSTTIPVERIDELKTDPAFQTDPQLSTYYYVFNMTRKPFTDLRVRKAMAMVIDRDDLVNRVLRGGEAPAYAMTPEMTGYTPPEMDKGSLEKAQSLMAEAGFKNGEGFPAFELLYNTDENHRKVAEYIQQQWEEKLGIKCDLVNQEFRTYLATRRGSQFDVARAGWVGDYKDPNTFLELFISNSAINGGRFENPEFDKMISEAAMMAPGAERFNKLYRAEEILLQEQAIIPLYIYQNQNMIDLEQWGGWYPNILDIHPMKDIYLKQ